MISDFLEDFGVSVWIFLLQDLFQLLFFRHNESFRFSTTIALVCHGGYIET